MPLLNAVITLTDKFTQNMPDSLDCQDASKLMLRCMYELGKNTYFTYGELVHFMKKNKNNNQYYKGKKTIRSEQNIEKYWSYAHNYSHNASIPEFQTYYNILS